VSACDRQCDVRRRTVRVAAPPAWRAAAALQGGSRAGRVCERWSCRRNPHTAHTSHTCRHTCHTT
jgi:hypothetical protein